MGSIIAQLVGQQHQRGLAELQQRGEWLRATAADPNLDESTRNYAASELNKLGAKVESHKEKKSKLLEQANAHQSILNQYLSGNSNVPEPMAAEAHGALSKMLPDHVRPSFDHFGEQTLPSLGAGQPPEAPPNPQLAMNDGSAASPSVQATQPPPQVAQPPQPPPQPAPAPLEPPPNTVAGQPSPVTASTVTTPNQSATASMPPSQVGSAPSAGFAIPTLPSAPPQQMQPPPQATGDAGGFRFHPFTPAEQGQRELEKTMPGAVAKIQLMEMQRATLLNQAKGLFPNDTVAQANYVLNHPVTRRVTQMQKPGEVQRDDQGNILSTGAPRVVTTGAGGQSNLVPTSIDGMTPPPVAGAPGEAPQEPGKAGLIAAPPPLLPPTQRRENAFYEAKHGMKPGSISPADFAKAHKEFEDDSRTDAQKQELIDKHENAVTIQDTRRLNQERLRNVNAKAANANAGIIPTEDIKFKAKQDILTGKTTTFARGPDQAVNQANYLQAMREAAEEQGMDPNDVVSRQVQVKADSAALGQLEKQTTMIESFANNTDKNFQLALKLGDRVDRTNSPAFNRWILKLRGEYKGDKDVDAFETSLNTAATDWAKVVTGQTTGQAVTDSARSKYDQMVSAAKSGKSLRNMYTEVVLPELANRKESLYGERQKLIGRISGKQPLSAPPATGGTVQMRAPNGQVGPVPTDQVEHYKQRGATVVQ